MIPAVGSGLGGPDGGLAAGTIALAREERLEVLRRRVAAAVRRVCPPWLALQADDIVQNVLLRLAGSTAEGEEERQFSSIYLEKAAYGATVDEIRRACRRREVPLPEDEGDGDLAPATAADPERSAASTEIGRGIRDCLRGLPRPRKLAVTLYLQGCSVPESAQRLGWSPKRTENLVYRGLADLRFCLSRKGLTP